MRGSGFLQAFIHLFRYRFDVGYRVRLEIADFERRKVEEINKHFERCNEWVGAVFCGEGR